VSEADRALSLVKLLPRALHRPSRCVERIAGFLIVREDVAKHQRGILRELMIELAAARSPHALSEETAARCRVAKPGKAS